MTRWPLRQTQPQIPSWAPLSAVRGCRTPEQKGSVNLDMETKRSVCLSVCLKGRRGEGRGGYRRGEEEKGEERAEGD